MQQASTAGPGQSGPGNAGLPTGPKRIILLLDGTWNDADFSSHDTNIVRLREIISESLAKQRTPLKPTGGAGSEGTDRTSVGATAPGADEVHHLVYYHRGVRTGAGLDRLTGGGFGDGLEQNVRRAYKFLSFHYAPGGEVFIFGFSRGAFTARSVVGHIASAGLLMREHCTPGREQEAWSYYRTSPDDRSPGNWHALGRYVHERTEDEGQVRIKCLGVFETVGALGVRLSALRRLNRQRYEFHNVELPSISEYNLHALAIDEHRRPFQAAIWREHKFKFLKREDTEQVWFAGGHLDSGGSPLDDDARRSLQATALDDLTLDWMLKRAAHHLGASFPFEPSVWKAVGAAAALARQHDLRRKEYLFWARNQRSIANHKVQLGKSEFIRPEVSEGYQRHETPADEMVHISAIERLGRSVQCEGRASAYAPPALVEVLTTIDGLCNGEGFGTQPEARIRVVDWTGEPLDPAADEHRDRVRALVEAAWQRLGTTKTRQRQTGATGP